MIDERFCHAAVSMGNKMFVIGGSYTKCCKVFNNFSRKFTKIYSEIYPHLDDLLFNKFNICNSIVVFQNFAKPLTDTVVYLYDVDKEIWTKV